MTPEHEERTLLTDGRYLNMLMTDHLQSGFLTCEWKDGLKTDWKVGLI
jgi:hypothetical protein